MFNTARCSAMSVPGTGRTRHASSGAVAKSSSRAELPRVLPSTSIGHPGVRFLVAAVSPGVLGMLSPAWAYVLLGATSIITEEATAVVAGFAAHQGHLHLGRAALACTIGSWAADLVLYGLGRWPRLRAPLRWRALERPIARLVRAVRRHPWRASLAVRFVYGARLLLPITCGTARIPFWQYVVGSAVSAVVWSAVFVGAGWSFGETAVMAIGHVRRHEDTIAGLLAIVVLVLVAVLTVRNEPRVPQEIEGAATVESDPHAEGSERES